MQYSALLVLEAEMRFRLAADISHRNTNLVLDDSRQDSRVRLWECQNLCRIASVLTLVAQVKEP